MIVLMAYDASEEGLANALKVRELGWMGAGALHLLGVMPVPTGLFLGEGYVPGEVLDEERATAESVLERGVQMLRARGLNATAHLAHGEPVEEITALAKSLHAELIVVRHERRSSFAARWWKGWVGSSLVEHAPCSVLIAVSE